MNDYEIIPGDCLEILPTLAECSIDSCVTDPPYELNFMSKNWDNTGIAYNAELWQQVLRVLKPGAHLLAFGGTRTYHRMACAIEDAGFEIRDQIQWIYGSGFPKSLDVSKAIDKLNGAEREVVSVGQPVKRMIPGADQDKTGSWIKDNGREFVPTITAAASDEAKQWDGWGTALKPANEPICMARKPLEKGLTVAQNVLKWGTGAINVKACGVPSRPVSPDHSGDYNSGDSDYSRISGQRNHSLSIQHQETFEPQPVSHIHPLANVVSRDRRDAGPQDSQSYCPICRRSDDEQPHLGLASDLDVAQINTDVHELPDRLCRGCDSPLNQSKPYTDNINIDAKSTGERFPANVIHDGSDEVLAGFPETTSGNLNEGHKRGIGHSSWKGGGGVIERDYGGDTGSAARFFYTAKASVSDREQGCDSLDDKILAYSNQAQAEVARGNDHKGKSGINTTKQRKNNHPTVKPVDLMQYLCRLVTPPNGLILDPFLGSGSTAKAALIERFRIIGIEIDAEYAAIAEARCKELQIKLF